MPRIPVYLSHSYRRADRDVNSYFWRAFYDAGFTCTVDPAPASPDTTALEFMMSRSAGFAAVVTYRPDGDQHKCSPFTLHEYGLAVRSRQPRLVLRDQRVPQRYFRARDTIEVDFDAAAPDRCAMELVSRLSQFRDLTSGRSSWHRCRRGRVGLALARDADVARPGAPSRRAVLEDVLGKDGDEVADLASHAHDPWRLAQAADDCDLVVVDLDDAWAARIADFLLGRGTPLLRVARWGGEPIQTERLLGNAPLCRGADAGDLLTYWSSAEELAARVRHRLSRSTADRIELAGLDEGRRYFRSLGREARPVFVSNAGSANGLASDLASALSLENIPFFHYRFQNPIGLGQRWRGQLVRMVTASKVFLPLVDDSFWARENCRQEYRAAVRLAGAGQLTIVPALLQGHASGPEIPYQGVDLSHLPQAEQVRRIVGHLDELLAGPPAGLPRRSRCARRAPAVRPAPGGRRGRGRPRLPGPCHGPGW